jgi:hypothetical protein
MAGMSLTSFVFRRRYSAKGTVVKKIPLINKGQIHLVHDISLNLRFKNETLAEKVITLRIILIKFIIHCIFIIHIILIISIILQLRVKLGIAEHVWQEKRAVIAATVERSSHH